MKQAPCSVQCIIKQLSIVNGWPVDPPKAKPFRCAQEIADRIRTQANGLQSPNATVDRSVSRTRRSAEFPSEPTSGGGLDLSKQESKTDNQIHRHGKTR